MCKCYINIGIYGRWKVNPLLSKMVLFGRIRPLANILNHLRKTSLRQYSSIIERELEVPTFCDVHIDLPYSVRIKPLNVHKYHNCDKLIIKFDEKCEESLQYDVDGNQIKIFDTLKGADDDISCSVKVPVKANLYVKSKKNIDVGFFHGDNLCLTSTDGNINVDKYQGNRVKLSTHYGNITLKDFIQASEIVATIMKKGCITSGRLQGLNLILKTNEGNISLESSYSYESHFELIKGNLDLHNVHKACKIFLHEGHINLVGFDGRLMVVSEEGSADIHLARITDDSEINILDGSLKLKIAESCQDYTKFEIKAKQCEVSENVKSTISNTKHVTLIPDVHEDNRMLINCVNGPVSIESASWQDMMKLRLKK